jgi:hypothetical protein
MGLPYPEEKMKSEIIKKLKKIGEFLFYLLIFLMGVNILQHAPEYGFWASTSLSVVGWLLVIYSIPAMISINRKI